MAPVSLTHEEHLARVLRMADRAGQLAIAALVSGDLATHNRYERYRNIALDGYTAYAREHGLVA